MIERKGMFMKKIAVVLSGCGNRDGTEITEAVSALIALSEAGVEYQCFAPSLEYNVINHATGEATPEKRGAIVEAARIARGNIKSLSDLQPQDYDGVVFPGGFGAAKSLSSWAVDGSKGVV